MPTFENKPVEQQEKAVTEALKEADLRGSNILRGPDELVSRGELETYRREVEGKATIRGGHFDSLEAQLSGRGNQTDQVDAVDTVLNNFSKKDVAAGEDYVDQNNDGLASLEEALDFIRRNNQE